MICIQKHGFIWYSPTGRHRCLSYHITWANLGLGDQHMWLLRSTVARRKKNLLDMAWDGCLPQFHYPFDLCQGWHLYMTKYVSTNRIVKEIVSLGVKGLSPDTVWGDTPQTKKSFHWFGPIQLWNFGFSFLLVSSHMLHGARIFTNIGPKNHPVL